MYVYCVYMLMFIYLIPHSLLLQADLAPEWEPGLCQYFSAAIPLLYARKWVHIPLFVSTHEPVVYVVPLSHILSKLPLLPAGDYGTIPQCMNCRKDACFPRGQCDCHEQGSGSKLFYINTWAVIWPTDYAASKYKMK